MHDLSFTFRTLARTRGVTAAAILTLTLAIGVNTAMFSVVHAVLLRPLPYRDPTRLVAIRAQIPRLNVSAALVEYHLYAEWWRTRSRSFDTWSAFTPGTANLTLGDQPEHLATVRVSAGFLSLLGLHPALGRSFLPAEDQPGGPPVAILSDALWRRRFAAGLAIAGTTIVLDRHPYTIVGVLSPGFDLYGADVDVYLPLAASTARAPGMPSVGVLARLRPGVSLEAAQSDLDAICRDFAARYPYPNGWGPRLWTLRGFQVRDIRSTLILLSVAVALVLLIACANVANLLMSRAGSRTREMAIRAALGASPLRIVRQLLTESAVLAGIAAALGLLAARAVVRALAAAPTGLPFQKDISIDLPVLGFTLAAALFTTLLFGLAPALAAARPQLASHLKHGARSTGEGHRLRSSLAVLEIALSLLLVIAATLTARSLANLERTDPGFLPDRVLAGTLTLSAAYSTPADRAALLRALADRLALIPGVTAAGAVSHLPFSSSKSGSAVRVEGAPPPRPGEQVIVFQRSADPGYFAALGCRLLCGRLFDRRDPPGSPIAVINLTMARRCWPSREPLGQRFGDGVPGHWITVMGVIADMRQTSLADEPDSEAYVPYSQAPLPGMSLVLGTSGDPAQLTRATRAAVRELDPELPISALAPLSGSLDASTRARRFSVALLASFALLAVLLASIGVYGVISYSVARRTREIAIRMALGAEQRTVALAVVARALTLALLGISLGALGALGLNRFLRSLLFGVSPNDPFTFAAASLVLLTLTALAAYLPARRAARTDPSTALRND